MAKVKPVAADDARSPFNWEQCSLSSIQCSGACASRLVVYLFGMLSALALWLPLGRTWNVIQTLFQSGTKRVALVTARTPPHAGSFDLDLARRLQLPCVPCCPQLRALFLYCALAFYDNTQQGSNAATVQLLWAPISSCKQKACF